MKRWYGDKKTGTICLLAFLLLLQGPGVKEVWGGETEDYLESGLAKQSKGDYDGAIIDYTKAIELEPDDAGLYWDRGMAKKYKGDYDGAIIDYTKAIELEPDYRNSYFFRGLAKYDKGDYDGAIIDYTKAIELEPDHAIEYPLRAYAYEKMGKFELAIEDYRKSLAINPNYLTPKKNLNRLFTVLNGNPEFITRIQVMLSILSYYHGDIDGVLDKKTEVALMAFQMDSKLKISGEINNETHQLLAKSYRDVITQTSTTPLKGGEFQINFPKEDAYETTQPTVPLDAVFKGNMEIDSIVVKINDQKVKDTPEIDYNPRRTSASIDCTLSLSRGNNVITLTAFTKQGKVFKEKMSVIHNPKEEERVGKKWAIVIGIEDYKDENIQDLDFAVDDAEEFTRTLIDKGGFSANQIILLTDKREKELKGVRRKTPTCDNIKRALFTRLRKETLIEDSVIIYYSGHGALVQDPISLSGKTAYLVPVDFEHDAPEVKGIKMDEIKLLAHLAPERMFLIIDSCYSGEGKSVSPGKLKVSANEITRGFAEVGKGRVIFTSCEDHQTSRESEEKEHGVFTYFLTEILNKGESRLSEINKYVYSKVMEYTGGAQEPNLNVGEQRGDILLY